MTTAHRPTWKAAVGRSNEGGWDSSRTSHVAVLNMAAHTKLKVRSGSQLVDKKKALRESLKKLEQAEETSKRAAEKAIGRRQVDMEVEEQGRLKLLKQTAEIDDKALRQKYDDADADASDDGGGSDGGDFGNLDDDDSSGDDLDASDSDDDSDDDDSDDEDEEAALQAELAKIRAEREAAKAKADAKVAAEEEAKNEEAALLGNPLLASTDIGSGKLKRKWNDDVVFRNQSKGEPEIKKRFINDTVRNDFHKRFLNKFIR